MTYRQGKQKTVQNSQIQLRKNDSEKKKAGVQPRKREIKRKTDNPS